MTRQFCLNESNSKCPSCKQQQVEESEYCKSNDCVGQTASQQLEEAKKTCPTDPLFADPKMALTPPPNSGFALGGTTGGGAMEALKNPVVKEEKKVKEGAQKLSVGSTDVDGGGGGGYSYGGGSGYDGDSWKSKYRPAGLMGGTAGLPADAKPGAPGGNMMLTPEVSASKSLFTMSTEAIKSRCVRGMLNERCRP